MTKSLPPNPSVKFLKLEAKNVLKAHKKGDPSCCVVLRNLHHFKEKRDSEILESETSLQEVQFALAMEYGFKNWSDLKIVTERKKSRMVNLSSIKLNGNICRTDSFSLVMCEVARLNNQEIDPEMIEMLSTNPFAPNRI